MNMYDIRIISSLEKILPNNKILDLPILHSLKLFKGQTASFQIAYRYTGNFYSNQTLIQGSRNPELKIVLGGSASNFANVRKVDVVPVTSACIGRFDDNYISHEAGLFPDVLTEFDGWLQFIPGQWRALWVEISVPETISLSDYSLNIDFFDKNNDIQAHSNLSLHIIPICLPPQTLIHTEWFHSDCLADYYKVPVFSEKHWTLIENFLKLAVKRSCNMIYTPLFTPALDTLIGKERTTTQLVDVYVSKNGYTFGFDKLVRWIELCKNLGFQYFEMCHLFTQWGAKYAPKIMAQEKDNQYQLFGWDTLADSQEYKGFLDAFLPKLTAKLEDLGVSKRTYFHISDEPTLQNEVSYKKAKDMITPYLQGYPILDALSHIELYTNGTVNLPVPANDSIQAFLDEKIEHPWVYYCCDQGKDVANRFIAMPSYRNRILGVQLYKYNIEGFLHWGYNFYNSQYSIKHINPFLVNDGIDTFPAGDTFIVYPGDNGQPCESLRLMVLADAVNDMRSLQLLESLSSREFVLSLIDNGLDFEITFGSYPHSSNYILNLFELVYSEIEKRL
ncbi:MAG: DUF4091 domain-containing protein [Oscillospiraceae bacterium]